MDQSIAFSMVKYCSLFSSEGTTAEVPDSEKERDLQPTDAMTKAEATTHELCRTVMQKPPWHAIQSLNPNSPYHSRNPLKSRE